MSDAPQGPGWWLGVDGRWYAPELHPQYGTPQGPPAPPSPGQPIAPWNQPATGWGQPGYTAYPGPAPARAPRRPGSPPMYGDLWMHHGEFYIAIGLLAAVVTMAASAWAFTVFELPSDVPAPAFLGLSLVGLLAMAWAAVGGAVFEMTGCLGFLVWGFNVFFSPGVRRVMTAVNGGMVMGLFLTVAAAGF